MSVRKVGHQKADDLLLIVKPTDSKPVWWYITSIDEALNHKKRAIYQIARFLIFLDLLLDSGFIHQS